MDTCIRLFMKLQTIMGILARISFHKKNVDPLVPSPSSVEQFTKSTCLVAECKL